MNSAEILIKFKGDSTDADKSIKNVSSSLGGLTKAFTIGNLAAKGITKAIEIFNSGLDDSINRIDTMNNFTTVMSNLGIASEDSADVIQSLSEELVGLPTTLNSAASSVQRLTSYNGDIKKSEQYFLAMNNAIIAGTNDANMQASAMEQLTQAYTKGKPDMQDWKTLLQAMPAQLKQVATAMGYVQTDQLYEALKNGEVSMNDFMDTLVDLNENGVDGLANLEEQARSNTSGIKTSVRNMKTAFVRGISKIIKSIDGALEPMGGLTGVISSIGTIGEKIFSGLGDTIATIIPPLLEIVQEILPVLQNIFQQLAPFLTSMFQQIMPFITKIAQTLLPVITNLMNTLLPPLMQIAEAVLPLIISLIEPLLPLLQPILDLLTPLIDVLMAIIMPLIEIINEILPPFIELLSTMLQAILPPLITLMDYCGQVLVNSIQYAFEIIKPIFELIGSNFRTIKNILSEVISFIKNVFTGNWKDAWKNVRNIFKNIMEGLGNILKFPLNQIITAINAFIKGLNKIKIPDWVPGVGGKGLSIPLIPKLATGTNYVPNDMFAMLHEGEAVVPKKFNPYANNSLNDSTIGIMKASSNIRPIVNVYANFETDPLGQTVSSIKTFSGGAKNDYNYGVGV